MNSGCRRRPLADDLAVRPRIIELIGGDAGQVIGGDVAHAVAARLDGVHLHGGKLREDVRHALERRPVELQILARREVAVAAVVALGDVAELAQLRELKQAIGDGDAQHGRMALDVQAVAQAQRPELLLRELPGEEPPRLIAKLRARARSTRV